jgi:hypothetical protein
VARNDLLCARKSLIYKNKKVVDKAIFAKLLIFKDIIFVDK